MKYASVKMYVQVERLTRGIIREEKYCKIIFLPEFPRNGCYGAVHKFRGG